MTPTVEVALLIVGISTFWTTAVAVGVGVNR